MPSRSPRGTATPDRLDCRLGPWRIHPPLLRAAGGNTGCSSTSIALYSVVALTPPPAAPVDGLAEGNAVDRSTNGSKSPRHGSTQDQPGRERTQDRARARG